MDKKWNDCISDEEITLLYNYDKKTATEILVKKYENYVWYIINLYFPTYRKSMDMFQSGVVGLLKAFKKFDSKKGLFPAYCTPYVKKECSGQIRFESGEESEYFHAINVSVNRAKTALESEGRDITVQEIMSRTNLSEKIVKREMKVDYQNVSYDLLSNSDFEPESLSDNVSAKEILSGLTKYSRMLVKLHVIDGYSFERIAKKLNKSVYVVTQDYKEAIETLRKQIIS